MSDESTKPAKSTKPKPSEVEADEPKRGMLPFHTLMSELQLGDDAISARGAALVTHQAVLDMGEEEVACFTPSDAQQYGLSIRRQNPMAWGAARAGDVVRFAVGMKACRGIADTVSGYQAAITKLLGI